MKLLNVSGLLGLISWCLIKNANLWNSPSGMSLFDELDSNKDGKITEEEGLTHPNMAIVRQWAAMLKKIS